MEYACNYKILDQLRWSYSIETNHFCQLISKLLIDGKLQTAFLEPTIPEVYPDGTSQDLNVTESTVVRDSGSTFKSYALKVESLNDIAAGINEIVTLPQVGNASHFIYAYRLKHDDKVLENFNSDDDHGMGFDLLRFLRDRNATNVICVVTRQCNLGFVHLGRKRFEHLRATSKIALDKLWSLVQ